MKALLMLRARRFWPLREFMNRSSLRLDMNPISVNTAGMRVLRNTAKLAVFTPRLSRPVFTYSCSMSRAIRSLRPPRAEG